MTTDRITWRDVLRSPFATARMVGRLLAKQRELEAKVSLLQHERADLRNTVSTLLVENSNLRRWQGARAMAFERERLS